MNMYPSLTNTRSYVAEKFFALQARAAREALWARLTGRQTSLDIFPEQAPRRNPNRRHLGLIEIPVEQIIGTLNRNNDFDRRFRPLKAYLRDRWINTYLTVEQDGSAPILVHKVGEGYYVEDGHHRVSVARSLGQRFIQARVWEYPVQPMPGGMRNCRKCPEGSTVPAYAAQ